MMQKKAFVPSKYQQAVFDWVVNGAGHAVIKAVPGSGKSTTLIQASKLLTTSNAVFLAFNVSIKDELNIKLEEVGSSMKAATINSFGFSALRATGKRYKVDGNKFRTICTEYLKARNAYDYKLLGKFVKLVSLTRMTLSSTDEESLWSLSEFYALEFDRLYEKDEWAVVWKGVQAVLDKGLQLADGPEGLIDFDDQVWIPVVKGLTPEKKDFIFVDESQDLNAARLELILRSVNGRGRLLFVGDENQSIYGFAGADTQSMNKIIQRTNATVLPLSICYRCPSSHIELCASIFPGLEAREDAPRGTIESISPYKLQEMVRPGDLVLCRVTAPLISTCLELIRSGVRAKVRGSDLGANFVATIKKLAKQFPRLNIESFVEHVNFYQEQQAMLIGVGDDAEMKLANLYDRVDTMKALFTAYVTENPEKSYQSMESFYSYIENFFSDERGPLVVLSTVHKAKGLEEKRVFILHPEKMPHPMAKTGWQMEQEMNIKYVAFSRSMDALYFVEEVTTPLLPQPTLPEIVEEELTEEGKESEASFTALLAQEELELLPIEEPVIEASETGKKHRGRPSTGKSHVHTKIHAEIKEQLDSLDVDQGELIETLLIEFFNRPESQREGLLERLPKSLNRKIRKDVQEVI